MTSRPDPHGKRALFEAPPTEPEDAIEDDPLVGGEPDRGIEALYSAGPHRRGTVVINCSHCGVHSRVSLVEVTVRILAISFWFPGKHFSRWMQCPNCQRRSWCRVEWLG